MIARRSVCATSKLELIDLIETGVGPDLFDRNIGFQVSGPARKVSQCANIEILVTLSLIRSIMYLNERKERSNWRERKG